MLKLVERSGKWHIHGTHLGVRVRETTGLDISEKAKAELLLERKIAEIEHQNNLPAIASTQQHPTNIMTLRQVMEKKIAVRELDNHSPALGEKLRSLIKRLGVWADIPATETALHEDKIKGMFIDLAPSSKSLYTQHIAAAVRYGISKGWIPECKIISGPIVKGTIDQTWTDAQAKEALNFLTRELDSSGAALLIALFTGLRIGEVSRIKTETVDLSERVFQVEPTGFARSKTKRRKHPIVTTLIPVFAWVIKHHGVKGGYLFGRGDGFDSLLDVNHRSERFSDRCRAKIEVMRRELKLPRIRVHDLRHTFAKMLVSSAAVSAYELKELMGHSTVTMTERYIGSLGLNDGLMNKLDKAIDTNLTQKGVNLGVN